MTITTPTLTYSQCVDYLYRRPAGGPKWSLEPTRRLLHAVGDPHTTFRSVHVGGTNGKGSVALLVYETLRRMGWKVGLYTSPHLVSVRERIIVDDVPISRRAFAAWTDRLHDVIEDTGASFFEATTALAFADFAARRVDIGVVEVGLGGRLDSTNVLVPEVSVVTNVSLEHTEYLGTSIEAIAGEKAGIAKAGGQLVVGEPNPTVAAIIRERAEARGARVIPVEPGGSFTGSIRMAGAHQRRNAAVAGAVLDALPDRLRPSRQVFDAAVASAWLPGRYERRGRWLFDVAHNPAGVDALVGTMRDDPVPRPIHALVAILADKDARAMLGRLNEVVDRFWLTVAPSAPPERRLEPEILRPWAGADPVVQPDFERALDEAQPDAGTILVTGSFHTVGDAMARLPAFRPYW